MNVQSILQSGRLGNGVAFFSGALMTLAFAPFGVFPFAIICVAVLLALLLQVSIKDAAIRGFLFGLGFFGTAAHWIFISMHTYGNMNVFFAALVTLFFIGVLAWFFAGIGYTLNYFFPDDHPTKRLYAFPALWLLFEWLRGWLFTGFPWLFLGESQLNSPLKGFAPILSVYGVSLMVLLSAALLYEIFNTLQQDQQKNKKSEKKTKYQKIYSFVFAFALLWAIGSVLSFFHWTKPLGAPIKASLVQGNIPQALKWTPEEVTPTLNRYLQFTNAHWDSQLIVWPEAAIPLPLQEAQSFVDALDVQAKKHHVSIITGIPVESPIPGSYYNAVIMIGDGTGIYAKRRLVPFGEYVPFQATFGKLFDLLNVPMSEFIPGPYIADPLHINSLKIATFVCYEIAYPEQVLRNSADTNLIVTVSNDAWFGHSVAQAQHLAIGQMRALELGRPMLFVSNNGITAFIAPDGKVSSQAPPYQPYVLTDTVQPMEGKTPLQRLNMLPIFFIGIWFFMLAWRARPPKPPSKKPWYGIIFSKTKL